MHQFGAQRLLHYYSYRHWPVFDCRLRCSTVFRCFVLVLEEWLNELCSTSFPSLAGKDAFDRNLNSFFAFKTNPSIFRTETIPTKSVNIFGCENSPFRSSKSDLINFISFPFSLTKNCKTALRRHEMVANGPQSLPIVKRLFFYQYFF